MRPVDRGGTGVSGRAFCRSRHPVADSGVSSRPCSAVRCLRGRLRFTARP
ncbi:hypothetical protein [Azospirillum palustre]